MHGPDRYGHRTIVQLGSDALTETAARRLFRKHAGNASWYSQDASGQLTQVRAPAAPATGPQKIQFVGHGSILEGMPLLGGNNAAQLARMLPAIRQGLPATARVEKITLVGCNTGCASRASLRNLLNHYLITTAGLSAEVKGYAGRVDVDAAGHKQIVEQGGLGNTPPPEAAPAPRVFRHGNVTLSQSGEARQLTIVGHGFWPRPGPRISLTARPRPAGYACPRTRPCISTRGKTSWSAACPARPRCARPCWPHRARAPRSCSRVP